MIAQFKNDEPAFGTFFTCQLETTFYIEGTPVRDFTVDENGLLVYTRTLKFSETERRDFFLTQTGVIVVAARHIDCDIDHHSFATGYWYLKLTEPQILPKSSTKKSYNNSRRKK